MNTVDVTRVIEQQKFGPLLFAIVAWSFAIMLTMGSTSPAFRLPRRRSCICGRAEGRVRPVFSMGLFGIMIGSIGFGYLGDRIGRKNAMIFGAFSSARLRSRRYSRPTCRR